MVPLKHMTIVVTGGSGLIGTELVRTLLAKGHTVVVIDKKGPALTHQQLFFIPCDLSTTTLPFNVLERTDAIINLAGSTIARKWTPKIKEDITNTRVLSTRHIVESLSQTAAKPSIFISASATGYYGNGKEELLDERAPKGDLFLSDVAAAWEKEALTAEDLGCRVVIVRTAPVLARGGFLAPLWNFSRFHLTGTIFKKDFWMPWIHINDLIRVYLFALETGTLQGVVNAAAPTPTRFSTLFRAFKKITKSISLGRNPFARLLYGEMIDAFSVDQKIVPQRLIDKGFSFAFTDVEHALQALSKEKNNETN